MQKFNDLLDRSLVPIATRLNNQRHIAAVRDAFMLIFPLTISSSLVILVNNILFSKTVLSCNYFNFHVSFQI